MRTFETRRLGPGQLAVVCPSRACGGKFVVSPSWLKGYRAESRIYKTASCPYCFKTAKRS